MSAIANIVLAVAPKARADYVSSFKGCGDAFAEFGINTPRRIAHFLAQVLHESGAFSVLHESLHYTTAERLLAIFGIGHHSAAIRPHEVDNLLKNSEALAERVYGLGNPAKAKELGNTRPGDGYRYRGAGALQTTGGANFHRISTLVGVDFYENPDLIVQPEYLLLPALHQWTEGRLNAAADANDITTITRVINGGKIGLKDRQHWFDKVLPLATEGAPAPAPAPAPAATPVEGTKWLQKALNDLGAKPPLVVDGNAGPATTAAIKTFQAVAGLKADGIAGNATRAAIHKKLGA